MGVKKGICKRCGNISVAYSGNCRYCNIPMDKYDLGIDFEDYKKLEHEELEEIDRHILEDVIKKSPEFSQEAMDFRIKDDEKFIKESARKYARSGPTIRCPYCNSTNTRKATPGSYVSHGFFGIFSKSFGKQWHCNSCGSDF